VGDDQGNLMLHSPSDNNVFHGTIAVQSGPSGWGRNLFIAGIGHHYLGWMRPPPQASTDASVLPEEHHRSRKLRQGHHHDHIAHPEEIAKEENASASNVDLKIAGLCCSKEVKIVKTSLLALPGVISVSVTVSSKQAQVVFDPSLVQTDKLLETLNEQKLNASLLFFPPIVSACDCCSSSSASHVSPLVAAVLPAPAAFSSHKSCHDDCCGQTSPHSGQALHAPSVQSDASGLVSTTAVSSLSVGLNQEGHVRSVLSVQGVCCRSEVPSVEQVCSKVKGVSGVYVCCLPIFIYLN